MLGFPSIFIWIMLNMDLNLFYALATASVFLFCLSHLGKKLDKMVDQEKIGEILRKILWSLSAFSLMIVWFGFFWEFSSRRLFDFSAILVEDSTLVPI